METNQMLASYLDNINLDGCDVSIGGVPLADFVMSPTHKKNIWLRLLKKVWGEWIKDFDGTNGTPISVPLPDLSGFSGSDYFVTRWSARNDHETDKRVKTIMLMVQTYLSVSRSNLNHAAPINMYDKHLEAGDVWFCHKKVEGVVGLKDQIASDLILKGYKVYQTGESYQGAILPAIGESRLTDEQKEKLQLVTEVMFNHIEMNEAELAYNLALQAEKSSLPIVGMASPHVLNALTAVGAIGNVPANLYLIDPMQSFFINWNVGWKDCLIVFKLLALAGIENKIEANVSPAIQILDVDDNGFTVALEQYKLVINSEGVFDDRGRRGARALILPKLDSELDGVINRGIVINSYASLLWSVIASLPEWKSDSTRSGRVGSTVRDIVLVNTPFISTEEAGGVGGGKRAMYDNSQVAVHGIPYNGLPLAPVKEWYKLADGVTRTQDNFWSVCKLSTFKRGVVDDEDVVTLSASSQVDLANRLNLALMNKGAQHAFSFAELKVSLYRFPKHLQESVLDIWVERYGVGDDYYSKLTSLIPNLKGLSLKAAKQVCFEQLELKAITKDSKGAKRLSLQFAVTATPLPPVVKPALGLFPAVNYAGVQEKQAMVFIGEESPTICSRYDIVSLPHAAITPAGIAWVLMDKHSRPNIEPGGFDHTVDGGLPFDKETWSWICKDNPEGLNIVKFYGRKSDTEFVIDYTDYTTHHDEHYVEGIWVSEGDVVCSAPSRAGGSNLMYDLVKMPEDGILQRLVISKNSFGNICVSVQYVNVCEIAKWRSLHKIMPSKPLHGDSCIYNGLNAVDGFTIKPGVEVVVPQDGNKSTDFAGRDIYLLAASACHVAQTNPQVKAMVEKANAASRGCGSKFSEGSTEHLRYNTFLASIGVYDELYSWYESEYGKPIWAMQESATNELVHLLREMYENKSQIKEKKEGSWYKLTLNAGDKDWYCMTTEQKAWVKEFKTKAWAAYYPEKLIVDRDHNECKWVDVATHTELVAMIPADKTKMVIPTFADYNNPNVSNKITGIIRVLRKQYRTYHNLPAFNSIHQNAAVYVQSRTKEAPDLSDMHLNVIFFPGHTLTKDYGEVEQVYQRSWGYYASPDQEHVKTDMAMELCTIPQSVTVGDTMQAVARALASGVAGGNGDEVGKAIAGEGGIQAMTAISAMFNGVPFFLDGQAVKVVAIKENGVINPEVLAALDTLPTWKEQVLAGTMEYQTMADLLGNFGITLADGSKYGKSFISLKMLSIMSPNPDKQSLPYLSFKLICAMLVGAHDVVKELNKRVYYTLKKLAESKGLIKTMMGRKSAQFKTIGLAGIPINRLWVRYSTESRSAYQIIDKVFRMIGVKNWYLLEPEELTAALSRAPLPFPAMLGIEVLYEGHSCYDKLHPSVAYTSPLSVFIDAGDNDGRSIYSC